MQPSQHFFFQLCFSFTCSLFYCFCVSAFFSPRHGRPPLDPRRINGQINHWHQAYRRRDSRRRGQLGPVALPCLQAAGLKLVAAWMFRGPGARPASQSSVAGVGLVLTKTQWVWVNIRADLTSMVLKKTRREESEQWRDSLPPQLGLRHVQVFLKKPRRAILSIGTRGRYQQH